MLDLRLAIGALFFALVGVMGVLAVSPWFLFLSLIGAVLAVYSVGHSS